jgi:hypothetical protein
MTRIIHFGVVPAAGHVESWWPPASVRDVVVRRLTGQTGLAAGFAVEQSFTDWSERFPQRPGDAIHVTHHTECDDYDADGDPIRLSADEVREVAEELAEVLGHGLRVVDYWLEDNGEEWGSDVHLHGPWGLESVSGRHFAGDRCLSAVTQ